MKKITLFIMLMLAMVLPAGASELWLGDDDKSKVGELPLRQYSGICRGGDTTLRVHKQYLGLAFSYRWSLATDTSTIICTDSVFATGMITESTEYLLRIDSLGTLYKTQRHSIVTDLSTPVRQDTISACDYYLWDVSEIRYYQNIDTYLRKASAVGCDSLIGLHLTLHKGTRSDTVATVCDGVVWSGLQCYSSGDYVYTMINDEGCLDSVVLHLTVNSSSTRDTIAVVCDSVNWYGATYALSGTHTHQIKNSKGCDSTINLHLTVRNSSTGVETISACDSIAWHGTTYTTGGTNVSQTFNEVFHTFNSEGCDSTVTVNLTVYPSAHMTDVVEACDSYIWPLNGRYYSMSENSDWVYRGKDANGCDTVVHLNLTVNYSSTGTLYDTVCDSFWWKGVAYTSSGSYQGDRLPEQNAAGCDSITTLVLTVKHSTQGIDIVTACDSVPWHGDKYYISTTAQHYMPGGNSVGCDSTVTLHLTINNSTSSSESMEACDSVTWHGTKYTTNGTKLFHTFNNNGCDSTISLNLTIHSRVHSTETFAACDNFVWSRNNVFYTGSNHVDWAYGGSDSHGCDSVIHLQLTLSLSHHYDTTASVCDSILWRGQKYYTPGDYIYSYPGSGPCTNDKTLHLTIRHAQHQSFNAVACDSYQWERTGATYNTSGIKTHSYLSSDGCPSVDTLHLVVNSSSSSVDEISVCDSLRWIDGNTYTESNNNAQFVINNVKGCDSTITLNLTIHRSTYSLATEDVCDEYLWAVNGQSYDRSGLYEYSTTDNHGCQITNRLDLTVRHGSYGSIHEAVCDKYEWRRGVYSNLFTESTYATLLYTNDENCPSIDTLYLTVFGYPVPEPRALVEKHHRGSSNPWMLVFPRSTGEQEYYYQWYRNGEPVKDANKQYFVLPTEQVGDTVVYSVWVASGNMSVCSSYSHDTIAIMQNKVLNISTYPNPAFDRFNVSVEGDDFEATLLEVYTESGRLVLSMPMQGNAINVEKKLPTGVYILHVLSADGKRLSDKVIIQ